MRRTRLLFAVATTSLAAAISAGACGSDDNAPVATVPDAALGLDAAGSKDSTAPDVATADAGVDATVGDAAPDAPRDAIADVTPPPACVDASALGVVPDGGPDAGCYEALPVFNTGVAAARTTLDGGVVDPHYTLIQSADTTFTGPDAVVATVIADGYWVPQSTESKWIAPSPNQAYPGASPCNAAGKYVYRTTFSLAGLDPATAVIKGNWAADNNGTAMRLNGTSLGFTAGYSPFAPFTITSGFNGSINTLEFEVTDSGCPNGLRVELTGFARVQK